MDRLTVHARSAITLVVLLAILIVAIVVGFAKAARPFPPLSVSDNGACTGRVIAAGDSLAPDQVTVSVLNAGTREGLAGTTLDDLTGAGFGRGELGNAPDGTDVSGVEIWTEVRPDPAARLLKSYLGKQATIVRQSSALPGISIVVGDKFSGVTTGRSSVPVEADFTVCGP